MGRPPRILSKAKSDTLMGDLKFIKIMLQPPRLTVDDLKSVLRHIDMMRDDLQKLIDNCKQK